MATTKKAPAKKKAAAKKAVAPKAEKAVIAAGEAAVYSMTGTQAGTVSLPAELFFAKWNADLVHQVVVGMQANARPTTAHTKFRSEVSGGGKKPWKQKGTGRARHGSSRSPIWVGGGVAHGPRAERDYTVKINRKMRARALASLLSRKFKDGEVIFIEKMVFDKPATAAAKAGLVAVAKAAGVSMLAERRNNAAVIALSSKDRNTERSFRNMGNLITEEVRNLNPVDIATRKFLVIENPAEALPLLAARLTN